MNLKEIEANQIINELLDEIRVAMKCNLTRYSYEKYDTRMEINQEGEYTDYHDVLNILEDFRMDEEECGDCSDGNGLD
ncbi:MAG TPA: hypothetical protein PKX31_00310 [Chitinophagaceae bacterium]|nr:hypothetical protein [Chitinophagaceae bacterium]